MRITCCMRLALFLRAAHIRCRVRLCLMLWCGLHATNHYLSTSTVSGVFALLFAQHPNPKCMAPQVAVT